MDLDLTLMVKSFSTGISNTLARAIARSSDGQCRPFVRAGAGSRARRNSHHSGVDSGIHPAGHREGQGAGARRGPWPAAAARLRLGTESMTPPLSDRLKDVQRQIRGDGAQHRHVAERAAGGVGGGEQLPVADRQVPGRISRAATGPRGVAVRAAHAPERGGDRGGGRRVGGRVDDASRPVAVGHLPRRPQQRMGYGETQHFSRLAACWLDASVEPCR